MANISIFQPDDQSATPPVIFPDSFIALKSTDPGSIQFLQALKLFLEDEERQVLKKLRGSAAAEVADYLDELIMMKLHGNPEFRRRTMRVLRSLCGAWGVLPASYTLHGEVEITDNRPWTHGGFSEVWRGTWRCEKVAVKVIIITGAANQDKLKKDKLKKQLSKEALFWKQLNHRNLLPFYGVSTHIEIPGIGYQHPCLVSPWMENGNIRVFVGNNPTFNRFNLLMDVCEGLIYLHSEGVVHGDLKVDNVLVDDENRACLADFGFAGVCVPSGLLGASNSSNVGGTLVYMAPELHNYRADEGQSHARPLKEPVDVYALGMLIYEVFSGRRPFHDYAREAIVDSVVNGDRPKQPLLPSILNPIWDMVELCWRKDPEERPKLDEILHSLTSACLHPPARWPSPPSTTWPSSDILSFQIQPISPIAALRQSIADTGQPLPPPGRSRMSRLGHGPNKTFP